MNKVYWFITLIAGILSGIELIFFVEETQLFSTFAAGWLISIPILMMLDEYKMAADNSVEEK